METAERLANFLQMTGGWGLSAVLCVVIWRMWEALKAKDKKVEAKDERVFQLLDKQNDVLKALERIERKPQ